MTNTTTLPPNQERVKGRVLGSMDDNFEFDQASETSVRSFPEKGTIHFKPALSSGASIDLGGIVSEQTTQAASEVWNTITDTLGVTGDAFVDLGRQFIGTTEKPAVPNAFQKVFEGEDPSNLDPAIQQEQIEKRADIEEALAHNRRIIQGIEDLQRQKGEDLLKTAQRVLETDPNSIIENSLRRSSKERTEKEVKLPKLGSDNPFEMAKQRANLSDYDVHFEAQQQGWAEDLVEEQQSEQSLAETTKKDMRYNLEDIEGTSQVSSGAAASGKAG